MKAVRKTLADKIVVDHRTDLIKHPYFMLQEIRELDAISKASYLLSYGFSTRRTILFGENCPLLDLLWGTTFITNTIFLNFLSIFSSQGPYLL